MTSVEVNGRFRFEPGRVSFVLNEIADQEHAVLDFGNIQSVEQLRKVLDAVCRIGYEIGRLATAPPEKAASAPANNPIEEAERQYQAALKRAREDLDAAGRDALDKMRESRG